MQKKKIHSIAIIPMQKSIQLRLWMNNRCFNLNTFYLGNSTKTSL